LNSLQTNAATLEAIKKSGGRSNERSLPEMRQYVERMGYKVGWLDSMLLNY
jgi:folylpolyglutamate synthase